MSKNEDYLDSKLDDDCIYIVHDISGKLVATYHQEYISSLQLLDAGLYFITSKCKDSYETKRIMVTR